MLRGLKETDVHCPAVRAGIAPVCTNLPFTLGSAPADHHTWKLEVPAILPAPKLHTVACNKSQSPVQANGWKTRTLSSQSASTGLIARFKINPVIKKTIPSV